jgi:hypothetical protein
VLAGSRPPDNSAIHGLEQSGFPLPPAPLLGAGEGRKINSNGRSSSSNSNKCKAIVARGFG